MPTQVLTNKGGYIAWLTAHTSAMLRKRMHADQSETTYVCPKVLSDSARMKIPFAPT
jgi:hypothetical protein